MAKRRNHSGEPSRRGRMLRAVLVGLAFGILGCAVLLLLFSLAMTLQDVPAQLAVVFSVLCVAAGALVAGYMAARAMRENGIVMGLGAGALFYLAVMLANLLIGVEGGQVFSITRLLVVMLASAIGGVVGVNAKGKIRVR